MRSGNLPRSLQNSASPTRAVNPHARVTTNACGLRHRMPQRAPMACPDRRRAHCHLPPRALPGAQPQQHGAQCAGQHHEQLCAPPTFLITRHQPCAPRGRVRRANASRFAHAFSRLRIALVPSTCSSFCSTHCSPACAACCTAPCKRRARELLCGGFRITMECRIAVLKAPLLVTCGDAAAVRAERQCCE